MPDNANTDMGTYVSKKNISNSFRGILRISPDNIKGDIGFQGLDEIMYVYDSMGNRSALALSPKTIKVDKGEYHNSTFKDKMETIDSSGKVTNWNINQINKEEILIGDENHNFIHYNLRQFLDEYFATNTILEQLVPVGTIIWTALNGPMTLETLKKLPAKYEGWYDFCMGQSRNTWNNTVYDGATYGELAKILGHEGTGNFNLPDLRNKFLRSASDNSTPIIGSEEGDITIETHNAYTIENPQTNKYLVTQAITNHKHYMFVPRPYIPEGLGGTQCFGTPNQSYFNGYISGTVWVDNAQDYIVRITPVPNAFPTAGLTGPAVLTEEGNSIKPKENHPYNISLIPLIKIK